MKEMREKEYRSCLYISRAICVIVGIAINIVAFLDLFNNNKMEVTSGEQYRVVEEYSFPDTLVNEDDYMVQYFTPQRTGLIRIEIRLAFNHEALLEEYGGKIRLRIRDKNQQILQEEMLSSEEIPNWGYYVLNMETALERGEQYVLELQQIEGPIDNNTGNYILSYVPFIYQYKEDNVKIQENGICEYHGHEQDYKWDLYYVYECVDQDSMSKLVLCDIFYVVILLLMPYFVKQYGSRKWTYTYMICLPLCEYMIVENITGNLQTIQPRYHLINISIIYILCLIVVLFFQNVKIGMLIINLCIPILALIEYYVCKLRGRSFMIQDSISLRTAGEVMNQYTYEFGSRIGIALLMVCILIDILFWLPKVRIEHLARTRKAAAVFITLGIFSMLINQDFMGKFEATQMNLWNVESNYQQKGYLFCLLSEIQFLDKDMPEGYSVAAVNSIKDTYTKKYEEKYDVGNVKRPENIILIMNESWADFRNMDSNFVSVTSFIDSLSENVIKGSIQMPVFGAGTSNSEYEVLTGNSMTFIGGGDCAYQLWTTAEEWGMARTLQSQGYGTVAMHPYAGKNWNRNIVYPHMGFEEFYSEENWFGDGLEYIRWCATDESCYNALIQMHEQKTGDEKGFYFIVTMQNHGGYDDEGYDATVELEYATQYPQAEQYLSLIQESDRAFEKLVTYFKDVDEPTMIIMFGDHLPNVEGEFYKELLGKSMDEMDLLTRQKLYQTPFVIWTNYGLEEEQDVQISSNYFGSYVLEKAGAELTNYDKCLLSFYEEMPILGMGMVMDKNENWYFMEELPENLKKIVENYEIIQYNRVFGRNKCIDEIFSLRK